MLRKLRLREKMVFLLKKRVIYEVLQNQLVSQFCKVK